ncbi:SnoaL-like domain-containing protein [Arcticibacter eurypsychrophilus]
MVNYIIKQHGRMAMSEVCVYKVKEGKIVTEEFIYSMPG